MLVVVLLAPWRLASNLLTIRFQHSDLQHNMSDCGVIAIANMVALVNGQNPSHMQYENSQVTRQWLLDALETKHFELCPHTHIECTEELTRFPLELFCSCKMPNDKRLCILNVRPVKIGIIPSVKVLLKCRKFTLKKLFFIVKTVKKQL